MPRLPAASGGPPETLVPLAVDGWLACRCGEVSGYRAEWFGEPVVFTCLACLIARLRRPA